jgi:hypothetical protein
VDRRQRLPLRTFTRENDMMTKRRPIRHTQHNSTTRGRPREGLRPGERVRDYPTVTVRLPNDVRSMLRALCSQMDMPLWQTIRHLTVCFVRDLPGGERRAVMRRAKTAAGA